MSAAELISTNVAEVMEITPACNKGIKRTRSLNDMDEVIQQVASGVSAKTVDKSTVSKKLKRSGRPKGKKSQKSKKVNKAVTVDVAASLCSIGDCNSSRNSVNTVDLSCDEDSMATNATATDGTQTDALPTNSLLSSSDVRTWINASSAMVSDDVRLLQRQVADLLLFVQQLSAQITLLSSQVSSIGSAYIDTNAQNTHNNQSWSWPVPTDTLSSTGEAHPFSATQMQFPPPGYVHCPDATGYSTMVAKPASQPARELQRQDLVASVYIDQSLKERKSRNVVISGLAYSSSDVDAVQGLFCSHFNYTAPIVSCKRIGRSESDRIQSTLVTLNSKDDAKYLIDNARSLRKSLNADIKMNVYLNADLTPAESRAAYELRCRRRQQKQDGQSTTGRTFYRSSSNKVTAVSAVQTIESRSTSDQRNADFPLTPTTPSVQPVIPPGVAGGLDTAGRQC